MAVVEIRLRMKVKRVGVTGMGYIKLFASLQKQQYSNPSSVVHPNEGTYILTDIYLTL